MCKKQTEQAKSHKLMISGRRVPRLFLKVLLLCVIVFVAVVSFLHPTTAQFPSRLFHSEQKLRNQIHLPKSVISDTAMASSADLKVLISGGGIAGNALAFWLTKLGHDVTVVERFPGLRTTGLQ